MITIYRFHCEKCKGVNEVRLGDKRAIMLRCDCFASG